MSDTPELDTRSALRCIRDALASAPDECPFHGSDFGRSGFRRGEPSCDSCKQPWRVTRARIALKYLEGGESGR